MAFVANPVHGLSLNGLVFVAGGQNVVYTDAPSGETYVLDVLDPETQWGNAEPITTTLLTLLTDGSQVAHLRDENREPSIALTVKASGPAALAAAEVALRRAVGEPGELRWQPPSAGSAVTVFEVVWSSLTHEMDSFGERGLRRSYKIPIEALPHGRSAEKTITPAIVTAAPTVVDSGSSATNWTAIGPTGAVVSVVSGAVRSTYDPDITVGGGFYGTNLRRTFPAPLDVSVNKYLAVDWKTSLATVHGLVAVNGVPFADLAEVRREPAAAGFTRSWYRFSDATTSLTQFTFSVIHPANAAASATLSIDQVLLANQLPASGTARQKTATILPGGSEPAEGTIKVEHPTAGLGLTVVFSHPVTEGYAPPLRPWLTASGANTPYPSGVSGSFHTLDVPTRYQIPASSVPKGDVQLWALLDRGSPGSHDITWAAQSGIGTSGVGDLQTGITTCYFPLASTWYLFPLARLTLPVTPVGRAGHIAIVINASNAGVILDDAWLFAMDKGHLTVVDCGTGAPLATAVHNRLRIDAPSAESPMGSIMIGTAADWSDSYVPPASKVLCDQTGHQFDPDDGSMIFTVTAGPTDAAVSLEHYRRWHTHAGS